MTEPPDLPARFRPLRPVARPRLALWFLVGAAIWLVALLVLAVIVDRTDVVRLALIVLGASFGIALVLLGLARVQRVRSERAT